MNSMFQWYKLILLYLWIAPHLLLAALLVLMYRRKLHKNFPVFCVYAVYEILVFLLLFLHRNTLVAPVRRTLYSDLFTASLAGSTALRFGVIREIFNNVLLNYSDLQKVAASAMRWVTGLLLVAAIAVAYHSPGTVSDSFLAGVALLDRSVAFIQVGLLLFLFLFSRMFGLSWRSFAVGVGLGFGILASVDLVVWALRLTNSRVAFIEGLNIALTGSYHVSVVLWLGYLLSAERPVTVAIDAVPELDRWSGELGRSS